MAVNGIHQQGQQQQGQRQAQRRRIGREGAPPRAPPPGAEVLEVRGDVQYTVGYSTVLYLEIYVQCPVAPLLLLYSFRHW